MVDVRHIICQHTINYMNHTPYDGIHVYVIISCNYMLRKYTKKLGINSLRPLLLPLITAKENTPRPTPTSKIGGGGGGAQKNQTH